MFLNAEDFENLCQLPSPAEMWAVLNLWVWASLRTWDIPFPLFNYPYFSSFSFVYAVPAFCPLFCGYKVFQVGYSSPLFFSCFPLSLCGMSICISFTWRQLYLATFTPPASAFLHPFTPAPKISPHTKTRTLLLPAPVVHILHTF